MMLLVINKLRLIVMIHCCCLIFLILILQPSKVTSYNNNNNIKDNNDDTKKKKTTTTTTTSSTFQSNNKSFDASSYSRNLASTASQMTTTTTTTNTEKLRQTFPETNPHVCLAFLSCCGRTDLLNHTMAAAIRHMEQDELISNPNFRYEIAWVDNGSGPEKTDFIKDLYPIEHALTLKDNMGLAYGMNLLIFNLCKAPYILLLEEDWLYLDDIVAPQTPQRKRVISTAVALTEHLEQTQQTAFDGRPVLGVFLRHETYDSFLKFPHADVWETTQVNLQSALPNNNNNNQECTIIDDGNDDDNNNNNNNDVCKTNNNNDSNNDEWIVPVDYRIFCADTGLHGETIWGSYTNGSGLYKRSHLINNIGRMYGEPGDAFHDRYVEGNYAYRVGLKYCHATIRLTSDTTCTRIDNVNCVGAFHHIGGGRGTRPMNAKNTKCSDMSWNFYGTPLYDKYHKFAKSVGQAINNCSPQELNELRERRFRDLDAEEYREQVRQDNEKVFQQEHEQRQKMKDQAKLLLQSDKNMLRAQVPWMAKMSDEEIEETAIKMQRLADSPHPLQGFWDSHGRAIEK